MRAILCLLFVTGLLVAQQDQPPTDARGWMNLGIQAYKNQQFNQAIEDFERAIRLDESNVNAHLYLGTAFMSTHVPGVQTPENLSAADHARREFLRVTELEPGNVRALSALAYLGLQEAPGIQDETAKQNKLDDAREWFLKVIQIDPRNRDALYSIGVVDWMKWYPNLMFARSKIGMKPEDPGPLRDAAVRADLRAKYGPIVEDGIVYLRKALDIDPNHSDAMAYLNLLYRERADISDSPEQYRSDMAEAEQWFQKALAARKNQNTLPLTAPPPPPPPLPANKPMTPTRIRVGSAQAANLVHKVDPIYPQLALQARIQGTIHFTAIIGKDGSVINLQLIGGHPLLVQAAQDAVRQWTYRPTLLNGEPVEVVTQIDVEFKVPVP